MQENTSVIKMVDVVPVSPFQFAAPLTISLEKGENWIVTGGNGAGKTMFVKTLGGSFLLKNGEITYASEVKDRSRSYDNIRFVTFHDQYGMTTEHMAYQMRWNQGVLDDEIPTVSEVLSKSLNGQEHGILKCLEMDDLMEKKVIMLSSGEFRRFQIAKVLLRQPKVLIIDNPFIGLDIHNRRLVADFFNELMKSQQLQLILVTCRYPEESLNISHVVQVSNGKILKFCRNEWRQKELTNIQPIHYDLPQNANTPATTDNVVLKLNNVSIKYGSRTILKDLNWTVQQGEHWALRGGNGVGKSTLLSLICADNPQGYACDITLFGHRRGSGESIWDIKRHIGFVSPEMYRSYRRSMPVEHIVASGLFDTVGLFRNPKPADLEVVSKWLKVFRVEHLKSRNYMQLSDGEQRLVLLIRAFVKNPDLFILDEPFHGLDENYRQLGKQVIEAYGKQPGKSIIMVSHYDEDFPSCITHQLTLVRNNN